MTIALHAPQGLMTEFEFILPRGLMDTDGNVHRRGRMRLATARDELMTQKDQRVHDYPDYAMLVLLAQVITQLGTLPRVTPELLESLFAADLAYLREAYNRLNQQGNLHIPAHCPHCSTQFEVKLIPAGE
jgi:hypothetical protein